MTLHDETLARDATRQDLAGGQDDASRPCREVYWATAGWDGSPTVEDLGTASNGGRTLARVTLYTGKPIGQKPKTGVASGHQVLVQIGGPLFAIPPLGTQVMCMFPGGDIETPGNGGIVMWAQPSPNAGKPLPLKATQAVLDVGANMALAIKGQWITLSDHLADTAGTFGSWLSVGPVLGGTTGVSCNDATGSGWTVGSGVVGVFATDNGTPPAAKAFIQVKKDALGIGIDSSALFKMDASGNVTLGCSNVLALPAGSVTVGALATALTPALVGPTGLAAIPSTSVFISP